MAGTRSATSADDLGEAPPVPRPRPGATLLALSMAGMVVSVQQTLVVPLLPTLMQTFHASVTAVTWVFTASLLAGAVATPLLSRFGDMYGKKRLILTTLVLLILGSAVCATSGSLEVLIAGRALQGTSAALIPLAIGMIRDTFPRDRVTMAIGVVSATMGIGGTLGMIVTGLIAPHTRSHHPIFWVAAGTGVVAVVLVAVSAHDRGTRTGGRPDLPGTALLAGWLSCLLLAISQGNGWGWGSAGVLGLFAAAIGLCALWALTETKVREPMVRPILLIGSKSLSANLASLLMGFSMFASFTLIAGFIRTAPESGYGLGGSVLDVGLYSLPNTATMLPASIYAGRLAARIGAAYTLAIGSVFAGLSYFWLAVSNGHGSDFVAFGALQGVGFGIAYAALGTLAVQHVPMDQSGIASGINSLVRTGGGSIAGAATAAILAGYTGVPGSAPALTGYVVCFVVVGAAAWLTAVVATVHGVRHPPAPGRRPVEALETS